MGEWVWKCNCEKLLHRKYQGWIGEVTFDSYDIDDSIRGVAKDSSENSVGHCFKTIQEDQMWPEEHLEISCKIKSLQADWKVKEGNQLTFWTWEKYVRW